MTKVEDDKYLLSIFEDVAKTQIPPQTAYAWIQKRLTAAHAEGVAEALEEDDYAIERVALVIAYEKGKAKGVAEGVAAERAAWEEVVRITTGVSNAPILAPTKGEL